MMTFYLFMPNFICVDFSPIRNASSIVNWQPLFRLSLTPVLYFSSLLHPIYLQITNPKGHSADIHAWISSSGTIEVPGLINRTRFRYSEISGSLV
jgi:hypothetical protein